MKAAFGWTLLSKEALKRAETQLRDDQQGVRDEIGFLALHQAYADRFFPGTSVLHTRLRYALFVPWLYQSLIERGERRRISSALERDEIALAGRLKAHNNEGVIGGRSYPRPSSQPAAMVYWTALGTWRILRRLPEGGWPDRSTVHRALSRRTSDPLLHDDDRNLLEESEPLFAGVPSPPPAWRDPRAPIDFALPRREAVFLRMRLLAVERPGQQGKPSLLARLVEVQLRDISELWDARVSEAAEPDDQLPLRRAAQAAALAAIGRGVYAALVESMRDRGDGVQTEDRHRQNLPAVIAQHRDAALALNVDAIRQDATGEISESILTVLRDTQAWLRHAKAPLEDLHRTYEEAERRRKGRQRARLSNSLVGRAKRAEWSPEQHPLAEPLHYRWRNVRRLLLDLEEAS